MEKNDAKDLIQTIPDYDKQSLLASLKHSVELYRKLRTALYDEKIILHNDVERKVMAHFDTLEK
ncbi:MAG: hypothetical protein ABIP51_07635 [Bacteroidia bacterium]